MLSLKKDAGTATFVCFSRPRVHKLLYLLCVFFSLYLEREKRKDRKRKVVDIPFAV